MSAIGLTTPARSAGLRNLQLNAGVFLIDFNRNGITTASGLRTAIATAIDNGTSILGITRGGGSFQVTSEMRTPEFDGQRYRYKGGEFVDSADAFLSTTLIEITPQNLKYAIGSGAIDQTGNIVSMHTQVTDEDYLPKLTWVGDLADGRFVLIELKNALNTSGLNFTFTDKGEGTVPVEFHAHQDEVSDYDEAPFKIVFLPGTALDSITVASAVGGTAGKTTITVSDYTPGGGESYYYKIGDSTTAPSAYYGMLPDITWTAGGTGTLTLTTGDNGKKMTLVSVNGEHKVVAAGSVTLAVKTS